MRFLGQGSLRAAGFCFTAALMCFKAHEPNSSAGTVTARGLPDREGEVVQPRPGLY